MGRNNPLKQQQNIKGALVHDWSPIITVKKFHFRPSLKLSLSSFAIPMASPSMKRWLRPEAYPLFATMALAVGICGMQLIRNICGNPEVRVTKENRTAGVLENFAEGEKYAEHSLRKFVRNKSPEIMPGINGFFTNPTTPK